jgi:hypothetical protein
VVSNEKGLVKFLVEILDKMCSANRWDFERKIFKFQGHVVDLLDSLRRIDKIFNFIRDLKSFIKFLPISR